MVLAGAGVVIIVAAIVIGSVLIWGGESNEEAAQKVVNGYYSALKAQDTDAAWNLLAADTREQIGSKSKLKEIIKTTFGDIKFTFKVGKATVKDNKATVKVVGTVDGKADTATLSLVKEDGVWRLDFVGTGEDAQGEDGSSAKSTAELRTCQANQRTVDGAVMSYQANDPQTRYPSSLNDMIQPGVQVLKSIPTCPSGKEYIWIPAKGSDPPYISCPVHPGP